MKRLQTQLCAALMTSSILLGGIPSVQAFASETDINGHWAQQQILSFAEKGYLAGDGAGNYLPNQAMTRAQFAAIVNRVMGFTEESAQIAAYTDVKENMWYYSDMAKALSAGYMSGDSPSTMSPDQPITREQAAVILIRLLYQDKTSDLTVLEGFADKDEISAFAVSAVSRLVQDGFLYGADGRLMPKKTLTRAEGVSFLSRTVDTLKKTEYEKTKEENNGEEKRAEEKQTEEKTESKTKNSSSKGGGGSSGGSGSGGGSSQGNVDTKPVLDICKAKQTRLVDLGRSQYVVVTFEKGFSKENTKLSIDGTDVTSNFTKVDDDGTIVKWELTALNPARLVLESGSSRQEIKLSDNQNPVKPEVLAKLPESYNLMANGAVPVWDYHLTNYDKAGNVRVYPEKTTFDLDMSDETIPYYSPDAEVNEGGTGQVTIMFNYTKAEERKWFDEITDVDLVAFNENNNTLNGDLKYNKTQVPHHGKTVGQISIPLGQRNFFNNGRYKIRVTSGGQSWLFPIHVVNETAPSMHLQGNGGVIQSGTNVRFQVENMAYGVNMPIYRVTLTAPDGNTRELEKITDWYLIGNLFVLYNDSEGHNNTPENGTYTIQVYADGFKTMETSFVVGSGASPLRYAGADVVSRATSSGGGASGGSGGSSVMNAYLIFDSDLLANAQILGALGIEQENAAKIAERWEQDMTSWLYVFDKGGTVFYDFSGKSGAFINLVNEARTRGEYLSFAAYQQSKQASVTRNRPYAAKYVLEDNLLGETQMGGSYIGRPAPRLTPIDSVVGKDLKFACEDMIYLAAIEKSGEICLNGDYLHPLGTEEYTVNLEDGTLSITKNRFIVGENAIRIGAAGYQQQEVQINYSKTIEEIRLEAVSGNTGQLVRISVVGEQVVGDFWKNLQKVKLTYPNGREKNILLDGQESVFDKIGYTFVGKNMILGKDLFTAAGTYQLSVTSEHYDTKTVEFVVGTIVTEETKAVPVYEDVTCQYGAFLKTYTFIFTPAYNKEIETWIKAIHKIMVNGIEYDSSVVANLYFTTNQTDQKIILYGDEAFKDDANTVVISAAGYEDVTLTVEKSGAIIKDAGESAEETDPEETAADTGTETTTESNTETETTTEEETEKTNVEQEAPRAKVLSYVENRRGADYYRLSFNAQEEDVAAYLHAITRITIDGHNCQRVTALNSSTQMNYLLSGNGAGGKHQFIDFGWSCFNSPYGVYRVQIIADGYKPLDLRVEGGELLKP